METLKNYNEDFVVKQMFAEELNGGELSNFINEEDYEYSDFNLLKLNPLHAIYSKGTARGRAVAAAEAEFKELMRKKYGKKWWMPKMRRKHKAEYKKLKAELIRKAIEEHKRKKFEFREEKRKARADRRLERKKAKWEAKGETEINLQQKQFEQQMQMQKQIQAEQDKINLQRLQANVPAPATEPEPKPEADKKKKQTMMIAGGVGGLLLIGLILFLTLRNRN